MFFDIFRTKASREQQKTDLNIYTALVNQARQPDFYRDYGIADTLDGRFEMVVLHVFLYCHRLKAAPSPAKKSAQRIFDTMVRDLDGSLREMGVGDLSVGKKIKPMIEVFYGRTAAYNTALESEDLTPLVQALHRNIYALENNADHYANKLAVYVRESVKLLAAYTDTQIAQGEFAFASLETSSTPAN